MPHLLPKIWHERLFVLSHKEISPISPTVKIDYLVIDEANAEHVVALRGSEHLPQFLQQLNQGDYGLYAVADGQMVGYGWVKHCGSDDFFFSIGEDIHYLCRFFVRESMRGKHIYPALISELIARQRADKYYIACERGNIASERGLTKVGFCFVEEIGFFRWLKITVGKKRLAKG